MIRWQKAQEFLCPEINVTDEPVTTRPKFTLEATMAKGESLHKSPKLMESAKYKKWPRYTLCLQETDLWRFLRLIHSDLSRRMISNDKFLAALLLILQPRTSS